MPHAGEQLESVPGKVSVTPGASPYTYTADRRGVVVISGGTVSTIELGRFGSFVTVGLAAGAIPVDEADQVKVTYTLAPTITFLSS